MKRIILKINVDGSIEPFTNLKEVFKVYPELKPKVDNIYSYFLRKKEEYKGDGFILRRQFVNVEHVTLN